MYKTRILPRIRERRILYDVSLELTYQCNLDCFYCNNDRTKLGTPLSLGQYEILLKDLARMQTMYLMLTGGEPMIHPHFFDIGRMARELGFVVRVRTNGHSLTSRISERLKKEVDPYVVEVSLHGATADVHDRQTKVPGSFDRLIQNLACVKQAGLRCGIVSTPTSWNAHQIEGMFALCDSLGLPLRFQGPVTPRDNGDPEPLTIQPKPATWEKVAKLVTHRRTAQRLLEPEPVSPATEPAKKSEEIATCSVGVSGVDIDPYGNVQACMHLQTPAGNLHDQSVEDIWNNSPVFQRARSASVAAALQFADKSPTQYGAPLFCIAVEENANKVCGSSCSKNCG